MKTTFFSSVLVMLFSVAIGQTNSTNYNFKSNISEKLFDKDKTEVFEIYSLQMLGKTAWKEYLDTDKINLTPKKFNWYFDIRNIESFKNMALNVRKQDFCGRDLPIDIHTEVTQNIYLKSISYP